MDTRRARKPSFGVSGCHVRVCREWATMGGTGGGVLGGEIGSKGERGALSG